MAANMSEDEKKKEMKHKMEAMWEGAAAAYSKWAIDHHMVLGLYSEFESFLAPELKGRDGVRILDVASASGEPAVTLATALPQAECVSTDLAHAFLELGKARAAKLGVGNISFETADAEDLHRYADASFNAVTCSLGLMFMPNYGEALREFHRVLKPGGLTAASVWRTITPCSGWLLSWQQNTTPPCWRVPRLPCALVTQRGCWLTWRQLAWAMYSARSCRWSFSCPNICGGKRWWRCHWQSRLLWPRPRRHGPGRMCGRRPARRCTSCCRQAGG